MPPKNIEVISAFLEQRSCQGPVSTDGGKLMSYDVVIAEWVGDEIVMPNSSTFHSMTTSKHRNLVRTLALSRHITVKEQN